MKAFKITAKERAYILRSRLVKAGSFKWGDVPKYFRVVFELDRYDDDQIKEVFSQLQRGVFKGLTGISDRNDIIFSWLGVARDAMLVMKGPETVRLNKLSRMLYGNPNYFLSNNMYMVRRLFNKLNDRMGDSNILQNILDYVFRALGKSGKVSKYAIDYCGPSSSYSRIAYKKKTNINSSKDLVRWMRKAGRLLELKEKDAEFKNSYLLGIIDTLAKLSDKDIEESIYDAFKEIGDIYGSEGEWVIKSNTFKIPEGSYLYILVPEKKYKEALQEKIDQPDLVPAREHMGYYDFMKKYDLLISNLEDYGINKRYKVKFIDNQEWERIRSIHFRKQDLKNKGQ